MSSLKNSRTSNFLPINTFLPELQTVRNPTRVPGLLQNFQPPWPISQTLRQKNAPTTLTNKPNTQVKKCYLFQVHIYENILFCLMVNFHFPMFKILFPYILLPKPKVSIYSVSVYYCLPLCKIWWTKANHQQNATSSNSNLFLSKVQKQDSIWKMQCSFNQLFHKY